MSNRHDSDTFDADDFVLTDDLEGIDIETENASSQRHRRHKSSPDARHRIEDRLEERRLKKELNEYEFFDLDDDILH